MVPNARCTWVGRQRMRVTIALQSPTVLGAIVARVPVVLHTLSLQDYDSYPEVRVQKGEGAKKFKQIRETVLRRSVTWRLFSIRI